MNMQKGGGSSYGGGGGSYGGGGMSSGGGGYGGGMSSGGGGYGGGMSSGSSYGGGMSSGGGYGGGMSSGGAGGYGSSASGSYNAAQSYDSETNFDDDDSYGSGNRQQMEGLVATAADRFGRLDIVVNNAGITRDRMLFNLSDDEWDLVLKVHLRGHFLLSRNAASYWRGRYKETGEPVDAAVVNTAPEAFLTGSPGQGHYAAAADLWKTFQDLVTHQDSLPPSEQPSVLGRPGTGGHLVLGSTNSQR